MQFAKKWARDLAKLLVFCNIYTTSMDHRIMYLKRFNGVGLTLKDPSQYIAGYAARRKKNQKK